MASGWARYTGAEPGCSQKARSQHPPGRTEAWAICGPETRLSHQLRKLRGRLMKPGLTSDWPTPTANNFHGFWLSQSLVLGLHCHPEVEVGPCFQKPFKIWVVRTPNINRKIVKIHEVFWALLIRRGSGHRFLMFVGGSAACWCYQSHRPGLSYKLRKLVIWSVAQQKWKGWAREKPALNIAKPTCHSSTPNLSFHLNLASSSCCSADLRLSVWEFWLTSGKLFPCERRRWKAVHRNRVWICRLQVIPQFDSQICGWEYNTVS